MATLEKKYEGAVLKFPLRDKPGENLLAWTTTPWTLSSNVGAAVNPTLTYLKVKHKDEIYYLAKGAFTTQRLEEQFRLLFVHIQAERTNGPGFQPVDHRHRVDQRAATGVDQHDPRLHPGDGWNVDEMAGRWQERSMKGYDVTDRQHLM